MTNEKIAAQPQVCVAAKPLIHIRFVGDRMNISWSIMLILCFIVSFGIACITVNAQTQKGPSHIVTRIIPPFVMEQDGRLTGFSVDLWHSIADRLGWSSNLTVTPGVTELLDFVRTGKADIGIAAVSITAERERTFDFSQPMFDSGLHILVRSSEGNRSSIIDILTTLLAQGMLKFMLWVLGVVLVLAHIVWIIERHKEDGIVPHNYWQAWGKLYGGPQQRWQPRPMKCPTPVGDE